MQTVKAIFKNAWPYMNDKMNLPVANLEMALPFYETVLGFTLTSKDNLPHKSAVLERDGISIGLAENGGDPKQEGCFFEVNDVAAAFKEFRLKGLQKQEADYKMQQHGATKWKVFFIIAPDELCYCIGERQS